MENFKDKYEEDKLIIIDENELLMNSNDGAMSELVIDAMKKDPIPVVIY